VRVALALLLLTGGCGFKRQGPDLDLSLDYDGAEPIDGGGSADLTGGGGGDLGTLDNCAHPALLVGVENVSGSSGGGKVLRFAIGSSGLTPCGTISGGGTLPAQPLAVAFVPPDAVAAATRDGLYLIGVDDVNRWNRAIPNPNYLPVDVFPIVTPQSQTVVAVGYWHAGTTNPEIDHVDLQADGNAPLFTFSQSGTVLSMTQSPIDPSHWFALDVGSVPAAAFDVDPYTPGSTTYHAAVGGSSALSTIYAASIGGYNRVVWVDGTSNGVYYVRENNGNPALSGPIKCPASTTTLIHAVPDPTNPTAFIGLGEHPGTTTRDILRWTSTGGPCDVLYSGASAGASTRLSRLALAL
jgi:hypothetical protein